MVTLWAGTLPTAAADRIRAPRVEAEEHVYDYEDARNGAGPMWCYGSSCVARAGQTVWVSALETIPGAKPLNNTRWALYRRNAAGWQRIAADPVGRTREPCPIALLDGKTLALSVNPTLAPLDSYSGPAQPEMLLFDVASDAPRQARALLPSWQGAPPFTEHSYRGLAADGRHGELLLMNVVGHIAQHWSFWDRRGEWTAKGRWEFPMGVEYARPEPIRLCYPTLALQDRAAHVLAISDIIEPVPAWREFKRQLTGQEWDYDFRRLFYAWSPDITRGTFGGTVEIASREATCGWITNLDIALERKDRAHLLWLERSVARSEMRDRFFPGTPMTVSLEHAVVERGAVVSRRTLAIGGEGAESVSPGYGRLHVDDRGRLYVLAYFSGQRDGTSVSENRLLLLQNDGTIARSWTLPLKRPFANFMTATSRAGTAPSRTLDILGPAEGQSGISYARVRLPDDLD
ncbi:MAG: hypothetical protein HUU17_07325 [Chthonomonadales bacterium]|nr:hypothetical protein [Chthonomonadales bacterium]